MKAIDVVRNALTLAVEGLPPEAPDPEDEGGLQPVLEPDQVG